MEIRLQYKYQIGISFIKEHFHLQIPRMRVCEFQYTRNHFGMPRLKLAHFDQYPGRIPVRFHTHTPRKFIATASETAYQA